jgi:hypothetical protein
VHGSPFIYVGVDEHEGCESHIRPHCFRRRLALHATGSGPRLPGAGAGARSHPSVDVGVCGRATEL